MPIKYLLNGKQINLTSDNTTINSTNFSVDKDGKAIMKDAQILGGNIDMIGDDTTPTINIKDYEGNVLEIYPMNFYMSYDYFGETISQYLQKYGYYVENESTGESTDVRYSGIKTPKVTQTSLEKEKKNFEKLDNGLEIIKNTDIYKYNLKSEKNTAKKHIGFVIGDDYNYSEEITSENNDGVDIYSMISVAYKAIQEQQELIEQLQNEIKELKGEK